MTAHRVWRVPADIDTDALAPGATMKFDIEVTAQHCLEGVRADFAQRVQHGDVIAAGLAVAVVILLVIGAGTVYRWLTG